MPSTNLVRFNDAVKLEELDERTFKVNFNPHYCVGNVVNGGYSAACMAIAATRYSSKRGQPHLVSAQHVFPDRCSAGHAVIVVEDVKKGKLLSNVQVSVWQGALLDSAPWFDRERSRRPLLAYMVVASMDDFDSSLTLPTAYKTHAELTGTSPPDPDFDRLRRDGRDDNWTLSVPPGDWSKDAATLAVKAMFVPRKGLFTPGVFDMWVRLTTGETLTQQTLPFVADLLPYEMDRYLFAPEVKEMVEQLQNQEKTTEASKGAGGGGGGGGGQKQGKSQPYWFATLALSLETKELLPEEGVEWLHVRLLAKQLSGGKFDQTIEIRDESGDLIMLGHMVSLALKFERNTKGLKSAL
ncbi:thioesterase family protein [Cordyceps javanica]|uniref:Thioesterase family protein n=1 Tax=Cordyceps javanica TaxID=43265 RepID=A0A545WEW4_9HYPO|nr:thioesterase family protein [Cordyceps javanica]TQW12365.1 thioesterase family protein [Cordyceps javanica]